MMNLYKILQINRGMQVKQRKILIQRKKQVKEIEICLLRLTAVLSLIWTQRRIKKLMEVKGFTQLQDQKGTSGVC